MQVLISQQGTITTQSGQKNSGRWLLRFLRENGSCFVENYMHWLSSSDMRAGEICLEFASREEVVSYAKEHKLSYIITEPKLTPHKKPKSYASNFGDPSYR